jgi:hypothetical protein
MTRSTLDRLLANAAKGGVAGPLAFTAMKEAR